MLTLYRPPFDARNQLKLAERILEGKFDKLPPQYSKVRKDFTPDGYYKYKRITLYVWCRIYLQ